MAAPGAVLGQVRALPPPVVRLDALPGANCRRHLVALAAVRLLCGGLPALIPATEAGRKAGEQAHLEVGGGGELELRLRMADAAGPLIFILLLITRGGETTASALPFVYTNYV